VITDLWDNLWFYVAVSSWGFTIGASIRIYQKLKELRNRIPNHITETDRQDKNG
jgi:hypothetical protein